MLSPLTEKDVFYVSNLQAIFPEQKRSFLSTASHTVSGLKAMN